MDILVLSFLILLSVCLQSAASKETITVEPGQSVSLPCQAPNNTHIVVVEWTRPELEQQYVLMYRDGWSVPGKQLPSYQNRVELKDRKMKDGDVSMILKNVTSNDTGTYECRAVLGWRRKKRANLKTKPISIIHLDVKLNEVHLNESQSPNSGGTDDLTVEGGDKERGVKGEGGKEEEDENQLVRPVVGLSVGVVFAFVVGSLICKKGDKRTQTNSNSKKPLLPVNKDEDDDDEINAADTSALSESPSPK